MHWRIGFLGGVGVFGLLLASRCDLPEGGLADATADVVSLDAGADATDDVSDSSADAADAGDAMVATSPDAIAGLQAWYLADLTVTSDAGTVSAWPDQSGNGDPNRDLAQATPALRPTLNATDLAFNGHSSVVTTSGKSSSLVSGTWTVPLIQPFTVFAVARASSTLDSWLFDSAAGPEATISTRNPGYLHLYAGSYGPDLGAATNTTYCLIAIFDSLSSNTRLFISQNTSLPGTNIGVAAPSPLLVGDAANDPTGAYTGWSIAELAFYKGALSAGEVASLNSYASLRYKLAIGP